MSNSNDFVIENDILVKYTGSDTQVIVPEGVTRIGRWAFQSSRTIRSVTLPDSLEQIERDAFRATTLEEVRFGANLKRLGQGCFSNCTNLIHITLPKNVTTIEPACFEGCMRLTTVELPAGLQRLGGAAFECCYALKTIQLPSSLTEIEDSTFKQCVELEHIQIPSTIEKIGMWTFFCCRNLQEIVIPNSVKEIGRQAFYECSSMIKAVLSNGLEKLEDELFIHCEQLKEIVIPDSVCAMGNDVFKNCKMIAKGYVSDRLSLAARSCEDKKWIAFLFCLAPEKHSPERTEEMLPYLSRQKKWILRSAIWENAPIVVENLFKMSIAQPKHVEEAEMYSFGTEISQEIRLVMDAYKLVPKVAKKKEQVPGMPLAEAKKLWTLAQDEECNYIIKGYKGAAEVVEIPDMIAGKPVVTVAEEALRPYKIGRPSAQTANLINIREIKIPSSITKIEEGAFCGIRLKSITLPDQVQSIGVVAFGSCWELEKLVLPSNLKEIPERMCIACRALKEVEIPETVQVIGKSAFANCGKLTLTVNNDLAENYARENGIPYVRK